MADAIVPATGTFYASFATLAINLITKFGSVATVIRTPPAGVYSPTLGRGQSGAVEAYPTIAVASAWTFSRRPTMALSEGSQRVLVAAQSVAITPNAQIDVLEWNGMRLRIVSGTIVAPGGVPILYDLECVGVSPSTYLPQDIDPNEDRVLDRDRNIMVTRDGVPPNVRALP